jgi:hypothetical protein
MIDLSSFDRKDLTSVDSHTWQSLILVEGSGSFRLGDPAEGSKSLGVDP